MAGSKGAFLTYDSKKGKVTGMGIEVHATNNVRSVRNGKRKVDEVVRSIPDGKPYDPQPFPKGTWTITGCEYIDASATQTRKVYGPVKIRTDAHQCVNVWTLTKDGDYKEETNTVVDDEAYLLHYSESKTTLGCIRIGSSAEAMELAEWIEKHKGKVFLEVV